jgi:transposase
MRPDQLDELEAAVSSRHASLEVKLHALYAHYFLGMTIGEVAAAFSKSARQILRWKRIYQLTGSLTSKRRGSRRRFNELDRKWILAHYGKNSVSYLEETCRAFREERGLTISKTRVWELVHAAGLTWKVGKRCPLCI